MRILAAIVSLCALCVAITYAATGTTQPANLNSVGLVNVDKLMAEYDEAKQANVQLRTLEKKLDGQLRMMAAHRLLNEKEMTEYVRLQLKNKPTPADKTRIAALEDLDKQREEKLKSLQTQTSPTQQQKQDIVELQGYVNESAKVIEKSQKDYQKQMSDLNTQLTVDVAKDVKTAIEEVAKDTNTSLVFNRAAVIVGGTDLTDEVLQKLNKGKKQAG